MSAAKCETGWGDGLSAEAVPLWRDHPTPLALRAIDPPPPGEGKPTPLPQLSAIAATFH